MAALDPDSDVEDVNLESGYEELKQRLELLLGAKPQVAPDEEERKTREAEAERLARRQRVASAGGQLLSAAFQFLAEVLPAPADPAPQREMAEAFRTRLAECVETDETGQLRFTVTLPDRAGLDRLANSLAGLLAGQLQI
ncbi:MAG: hypothetical protein ACE15E_19280 [Acidobacteriota bacterium]